jgi:hypothetical protein
MIEIKISYIILAAKHELRNHLEEQGIDGNMILNGF